MRAGFAIAVCICLTACVKTSLPPFQQITHVEVRGCRSPQYDYFGAITAPEKLATLMEFINRPRPKWTRTFVFDFGDPQAMVRADLYEGNTYVGYFAVGGGALPGKRAFFEVRRGNILARLTVPISEANNFIDLIGARGARLINTSMWSNPAMQRTMTAPMTVFETMRTSLLRLVVADLVCR